VQTCWSVNKMHVTSVVPNSSDFAQANNQGR